MLGTIVIEKYKQNDRDQILSALETLTVANRQDWATAGLYSYWDYRTKEILYIGLAIDLVERFKQHNGFSKTTKGSSKFDEIQAYFKINEYIGFTIVLQSALSQPPSNRQRKKYKTFREELERILGDQGRKEIVRLEGILLEAFRQKYNRFPLWNKIGGDKTARKSVKESNHELLQLLVTNAANKFTSRVSLIKLASNATYCRYEAYLHSIRISPFSSAQTIQMHRKAFGIYTFDEIGISNYFKRRLNV